MNRTNGNVESINGRFRRSRFFNPLRLAIAIIRDEGQGIVEVQDTNQKINPITLLTKWAEGIFCGSNTTDAQLFTQGYRGYRTGSSDMTGYTLFKEDDRTMKDIDLQKPIPCNCGHTAAYGLHCRHVLSFLQCTKRLSSFSDYVKEWVPQRYHLRVYKEAYDEASIKPINPNELKPTLVRAPVFTPHPNAASNPNAVFSVPPANQHTTSTTTTTSVSPPPPPMIPQILPNDVAKKTGRKRTQRVANQGSSAKDGGTRGGGKKTRRRVDGGMEVPADHNPNFRGTRIGRGQNTQLAQYAEL